MFLRGWALRSPTLKILSVVDTFPIACRSRGKSLRFFSNTMSSYTSPCPAMMIMD